MSYHEETCRCHSENIICFFLIKNMHSIRFNKNTSVVVLNLFHNKKIMADLVNKRYQLLKITYYQLC